MWDLLFIQPITKSLFFLTNLTGNLGIAIIVLTLVIQLLLTPLRIPSIKSVEKMKELKPHLDVLKKKHKDDPQRLAMAQMELYKEHGINPIGGILTMILSLPIIIALYQVLRDVVSVQTEGTSFLWLNLAQPDSYYILPFLVAVSQWLLTRFMSIPQQSGTHDAKGEEKDAAADIAMSMQKNMQIIFPLMLGVITLQSPSGLGIYFVVSALFAIMQQVWIRSRLPKSNN